VLALSVTIVPAITTTPPEPPYPLFFPKPPIALIDANPEIQFLAFLVLVLI
jgi:hypothetical protein